MTSSTAVADQEPGRVRPALDAPERAALRETIRAEIARARPRPVALRTLELLAEGAVEPGEAGPGYRVLDRHGTPRSRADSAPDGAAPMTLADLMAELRAQHPGLFLPPEPEPEPEREPEEPKDSPLLASASEMRAATARFVEAQSERARSLAERSSMQGRALAQNAAGRFASLRAEIGARLARRPAGVAAPRGPDPAAWDAGPGRLGESVRAGLQRLRDRLDGSGDEAGRRHRRWLAGTGAVVLVAVVAAGLVLGGRDHETAPSPTAATDPAPPQAAGAPSQAAGAPSQAAGTPSQAAGTPSQAAGAAPAPDTVTPPPESGADPEPDAAPPAPNAPTGPAQVVDTATLKVGGKVVHLFGVEWVRGGQAEELTRYIAGRPVACQPAPGSESMNCVVDGRDLSEVVLFNGGGRASPEASPELVAAEDHARSERLGVWKR